MNGILKCLPFPLLIAAISGVAMAIQGTLNAGLSQKTSLYSATFVVHLIGTVIALAVILFKHEPLFSQKYLAVPWYFYLGGVLSVVIIALVAVSIPQVGVANATTAIIIGQVSMAILIDHFGWFGTAKMPWNLWQLLGLVLFAVGAKLLFRI
ncbi:MAG: DMT family transporter [Peptococcaceae bacterium]|nr:DMT family transporter [Peptococcaceae bacterium]